MKLTLNEKYILNERYVLTEADDDIDISDIGSQTSTPDDDINIDGPTDDWQKAFEQELDATKNLDLKNATKRINTLWDKYFAKEWGSNAQHAKDLGEGFKVELQTYGFTDSNPFVNFVKTLFNKKIFPKQAQYGVVHNMFVADKLTEKDIQGIGSAKHANIIFSMSFYNKQPQDCEVLLKRQKTILNNGVTEVIKARGYKDNQEIIRDVFYSPRTHNTDSDRILPEGDLENGIINSIQQVDENYRKISNTVITGKEKEKLKLSDLDDIIKTREDALKVINVLRAKTINQQPWENIEKILKSPENNIYADVNNVSVKGDDLAAITKALLNKKIGGFSTVIQEIIDRWIKQK